MCLDLDFCRSSYSAPRYILLDYNIKNIGFCYNKDSRLLNLIYVLRFAVGHFVVIRLLSQSVVIVRVVGSVRRVRRVGSVVFKIPFFKGGCLRSILGDF